MIGLAALAVLVAAPIGRADGPPVRTEVIVTLDAPSLADWVQGSRVLSAAAKAQRLDLRSASSADYLDFLSKRQDEIAHRIEREIPSATVRRRYQVVLDGLAVWLPRDRLVDLRRIAGVDDLFANTRYRVALNKSPELIGADQLWGLPSLTTAGQGIKIGIIDQGIDQKHPFFDPTGYSYPPGFPKGNTAFTTPKVIVARSFVPPGSSPVESLPFADAGQIDDHGTHVAGIAAGNYDTEAISSLGTLSGVAPRAYLGNYKAMALNVGDFALIENATGLVAAIEAAVRDGMDVINMSLGEIEVDPSRSVVDDAVDGAAKAGVVPVVAAGNDFEDVGRGSINTPGSAPLAISVAAATKADAIAGFSSSGPAPLSLALKPDVTAPGVSILSSVPPKVGTWVTLSGTSMATPHVAGAAALLRQRHPDWTVAQIKSALVLTGSPVLSDTGATEAPTTREGGGMINLPKADKPLVFAQPTGLSFGLLQPRRSAARTIRLTDAGGGAGPWTVSVELQSPAGGVTVSAPATVTVPGNLSVKATVAANAGETDVTGFVVLTLGSDERRVPFWFRTERPRLGKPSATLRGSGTYRGDARKGKARVSAYRYPDNPTGLGVSNNLPGPEQVFRVRVRGRVANFGVVVTGQGAGVRVTPRIVAGNDENRLLGYRALPVDLNPYLSTYGDSQLVVSGVRPAPGTYSIVFDTPSRSSAGPFTFRYWINDSSPPSARLLTTSVASNGALTVAVTDGGAGVDPTTILATIDGTRVRPSFRPGLVSIPLGGLAPGRHRLDLQVSDYQEEKNSESVPRVLPNTRVLRATFTVR